MTITPLVKPGTITPVWNLIRPINGITPFTYRDGRTFLEVLEELRSQVNVDLIPGINAMIDTLVEQLNQSNTEFAGQINIVISELEDLIDSINNRVGPADVQHVLLVSDSQFDWDPSWPTNQPVRLDVTQVTGGKTLELPDNVHGRYWINRRPGSKTRITLEPRGDGEFDVVQPFVVGEVSFNVLEYGAVGDGIADDTAAIQAAINAARDAARSTQLGASSVVYFPAGKYRVTSTITQPPYVRVSSLGTVTILSDVTGSAWHLTALSDDPATLYPKFEKQQWQSGSIINGTEGGFVFINNTPSPGKVALEVGSRTDLGALRCTARYNITGVSIYGFTKGLLMNTFNHYLATYTNVKIEMCDTHLHVIGNGVNSGENMTFTDCLFGVTPLGNLDASAVVVDAPNFDINFANCSFDFVASLLKINKAYSRFLFTGGHFEAVNEGNRFKEGNGIVVSTVQNLPTYDQARMPEVSIKAVPFVQAKRGVQFRGLMRLDLDMTYRVQADDTINNQSPDQGYLCDSLVLVERVRYNPRGGGPLVSRTRNQVQDSGLKKDAAGTLVGALTHFSETHESMTSGEVSGEAPVAGSQSLKAVLAATGFVRLTTKPKMPCQTGDTISATFALRTQANAASTAVVFTFYNSLDEVVSTQSVQLFHNGFVPLQWRLPSTPARVVVPAGASSYTAGFNVGSTLGDTVWIGDFHSSKV